MITTSPETQNVTAGQSFILTCSATGYSVPSIEWTLNGTIYITADPPVTTITIVEVQRSNTSVLVVSDAKVNDTGMYQCIATNVVNTDTQDANVTVQGSCVVSRIYSREVFWGKIWKIYSSQTLDEERFGK